MEKGDCFLRRSESSVHDMSSLLIWDKSREGRDYIIGADTAEGLEGGDFSAAVVFERTSPDSLVEVARYKGKASPTEFADIIRHLSAVYNSAFIMPEANSPGNVTCQKLFDYGVTHMYRRKNEEVVGSHNVQTPFLPGFKTHRGNKALIVERLSEGIRLGHIKFRSSDIIFEHQMFSNINGRYSAPSGGNDDCVIATALAYYGHITPTAAPPLIVKDTTDEDMSVYDSSDAMKEALRKKIRRSEKINRRKKKAAEARAKVVGYNWGTLRA